MPKYIVKIRASITGEVQLEAEDANSAYDKVRRSVAARPDQYRTLIQGGVGSLSVLREVAEVQPQPPSSIRADGKPGDFGLADYILEKP